MNSSLGRLETVLVGDLSIVGHTLYIYICLLLCTLYMNTWFNNYPLWVYSHCKRMRSLTYTTRHQDGKDGGAAFYMRFIWRSFHFAYGFCMKSFFYIYIWDLFCMTPAQGWAHHINRSGGWHSASKEVYIV